MCYVQLQGEVIENDDGVSVIVGTLNDITEQNTKDEERYKLATVLGFLELARTKKVSDESMKQYLSPVDP